MAYWLSRNTYSFDIILKRNKWNMYKWKKQSWIMKEKNTSYVFNIINNENILFYVNKYVHEILKFAGFIFVCRFSRLEKCQNDQKLNSFLLLTYWSSTRKYKYMSSWRLFSPKRFWTRQNYFGHVQNVLNRTKNNQETRFSRQITNLSFNQGSTIVICTVICISDKFR